MFAQARLWLVGLFDDILVWDRTIILESKSLSNLISDKKGFKFNGVLGYVVVRACPHSGLNLERPKCSLLLKYVNGSLIKLIN